MLSLPATVIVMGVSGSGKTTLGQALAAHYGWTFLDADDFHTPEARARMQRGEGLSSADRAPWLARLHAELLARRQRGESVVLACSALRAAYRQQLLVPQAHFLYLDVPAELLCLRLRSRPQHYAGVSLLPSQLLALEVPGPAEALTLKVSADDTPLTVLERALRELEKA